MANRDFRPTYHHPSRPYHIGNDFGPHSQAPLPPARERFWQPSPHRYRTRSHSRSRSRHVTHQQRKDRARGRAQGDCYPGTRRAHRYRSPSPSATAPRYPSGARSPWSRFSQATPSDLLPVYSTYSKHNLVSYVPNSQNLSRQALQNRYTRSEAHVWHEMKRGEGHMDLWSRTTLAMRDRGWNWEYAWDREMHERVWGKAVEEVERDDRRRDDESREGANDVRGRALEAERGRQRTRESTEELAEQLGRQRKEGVTGSAAEILERSLLKTDVTAEQANQADERTRDHEDDAGAAKDRKPTKNDAEGDTAASNAIKGGVAADRGRVVQKRKRDGGDEADAGTAAKRTRADSEGDGVGQKSVGIALR